MPFLVTASKRRWLTLAALAAVLVGAEARAVVIQINGTISPVETGACPGAGDHCLQSTLNVGEGLPVGSTTNALEARQYAATAPELFTVPKDGTGKFKTVTFYFTQHGGSYNNDFGWYNADDPSTRYKVFSGNQKANFSIPDLNISSALNFQTLCNPTAGVCGGTYHGGAIGFYLAVPDDNNRLYYTQKELNADGNYVHFLVYSSLVDLDAVTGQPLSFYFGFEDLYRGGDNDFDDSAFKVSGLVVPCQRMKEICDGKDNDCDGIIDNVDYSGLGACFPPGYPAANQGKGICTGGNWVCTSSGGVFQDSCVGATFPSTTDYCDGKDNNCNGTVDEGGVDPTTNINNVCPTDALAGECDAKLACLNGTVACQVVTGPAAEICDGKDNNCNGQTDEVDGLVDTGRNCNCTGQVDENLNQVPGGAACAGPSQGECHSGQTVCTTGKLFCQGYQGPGTEICDGKDNNCNGAIDEGLTGLGTCSPATPPGIHVCTPGANQCVNGVIVCTGFKLGSPERCNGVDDDCNGVKDDNPIDVGLPCGNTLGICTGGTTACVNGGITCSGIGQGPKQEVCDGVDNNCNGAIDENLPGSPLPGVGDPCQQTAQCTGTKACIAGTLQCLVTSGKPEICDGLDNDCNGQIDDNPIDVGGVCSTSITKATGNKGECKFGTLMCDPVTHKPTCVGEVGPKPESCNGKDDNCDGFIDNDPDGTGPFILGGDLGGRTVLVGEACGGAEGGNPGCLTGSFVCKDGSMTCDTESIVRVEVCNGIDDDCDGLIDESTPTEPLPRVGDACGSAFPPCQPGTLACVAGELQCQNGTSGTEEICNGIDDDCNGIVDDPAPNTTFAHDGDECYADGVKLPLSDKSLCRAGALHCYNGKMACLNAVGPFKQELCNGIDDTCDGEVDEGAQCPDGTQCVQGGCRQACHDTEFSTCPGGSSCRGGYCVPDVTKDGGTNGGGGLGNGPDGSSSGFGGNGAGARNGRDGGGASKGFGGATGADGGFIDGGNGMGANGAGANGNGNGKGTGGAGKDNGPRDAYGLASGGGGLHCSVSFQRSSNEALSVLGLLGVALVFRRSRRQRKEGLR